MLIFLVPFAFDEVVILKVVEVIHLMLDDSSIILEDILNFLSIDFSQDASFR